MPPNFFASIATALLLLACSSSFAQTTPADVPGALPVDATTKLITYTDVVPTPGVPQSSLLARARVWANRVTLPSKPPLLVSEMGTDVLLVAGTQALNTSYSTAYQTLYFVVRIALREGRYQYRFEEYTLVAGSATEPATYTTAEAALLNGPPAKATGNSAATRLRRAFEEASKQAALSLHTALTTSLTAGPDLDPNW